jgi:anaerobic selenocysteine-containing dehydrogenase
VVRSFAAAGPRGEERPGIEILSALANALGGIFRYDGAADVTADIAEHVAGYVPFLQVASGRTRVLEAEGVAGTTRLQPVAAAGADAEPGAGLTVLTGRSLFTSWEGASIRSEQADQLHREESAVINPRDAEAAGVRDGDEIVLSDGRHELRIAARFDDGVAPGSVYVPHYYDAGAVMALFPLDGGTAAPRVQVRALQPA